MQISDIRLFVEVAEAGSFTKVAARRHTAQSHISRQFSEFEKTCGAALFQRTGRGVVLTEFGQTVLQRVRVWLADSDALFLDIQQSATVPMGEVKLGVLPSAAQPLMTEVFKRLRLGYPQIKLNIREGQGGELDALLDTGEVDMAILFRYELPKNSSDTLLATVSTFLVSKPNQVLTSQPTIKFRELANQALVLPRRSAHWRAVLDETARAQGFALNAVIEVDSLRIQKEILSTHQDLYAVLGPFSIDDELRLGRLRASKIVAPDLKRYVTLAKSKQGKMTKAHKVVADLIVETVKLWGGQVVAPRA